MTRILWKVATVGILCAIVLLPKYSWAAWRGLVRATPAALHYWHEGFSVATARNTDEGRFNFLKTQLRYPDLFNSLVLWSKDGAGTAPFGLELALEYPFSDPMLAQLVKNLENPEGSAMPRVICDVNPGSVEKAKAQESLDKIQKISGKIQSDEVQELVTDLLPVWPGYYPFSPQLLKALDSKELGRSPQRSKYITPQEAADKGLALYDKVQVSGEAHALFEKFTKNPQLLKNVHVELSKWVSDGKVFHDPELGKALVDALKKEASLKGDVVLRGSPRIQALFYAAMIAANWAAQVGKVAGKTAQVQTAAGARQPGSSSNDDVVGGAARLNILYKALTNQGGVISKAKAVNTTSHALEDNSPQSPVDTNGDSLRRKQ